MLLASAVISPAYAGEEANLESEVTSATLSEGNFSTWLSRPVTVTLNAPAWATSTKYHFGNGSFKTYGAPFAVTSEGKTTIYFQSTGAQSVESLQTAELWLDFKAPSTPGPIVFSEPKADGFAYNFGPSKDALSGIGSYEVTLTSMTASSTVATQSVSGTSGHLAKLSAGTYAFEYAARDLAGNTSEPQRSEVMVGLARPIITYTVDDPLIAQNIAAGEWVTTGVDVRLTAQISSQAPTATLKIGTLAGSVQTTDVAQNNYARIPLILNEQGAGNVTLSTTDLYGNESETTSIALKIDRTAPSAPTLVKATTARSLTDASRQNLGVSWEPSYDAASGIDFYRVTAAKKDAGFAGISTIDTTQKQAVFVGAESGTYDITVQAFDKAGLSSAPVKISRTITLGAAASSNTQSSSNTNKTSTTYITKETPTEEDLAGDIVDKGTSLQDGKSEDIVVGEDVSGNGSSPDGDNGAIDAMARTLGSAKTTAEQTIPEKIGTFLKNEWQIWVPALIALIALVILIVALIRRRSPDAGDGLEQTREFESLSLDDEKTAQPQEQSGDQAAQYFQINQ